MLKKETKVISIWKTLDKESKKMNNALEIRDSNFSTLLGCCRKTTESVHSVCTHLK